MVFLSQLIGSHPQFCWQELCEAFPSQDLIFAWFTCTVITVPKNDQAFNKVLASTVVENEFWKAQLNLFWWTFPFHMNKLSNTVNPRDYDSVLPSNASFWFTFDECHPIICCELICHALYRISWVCLFPPPLLMAGSLICFSGFLFYVFNWASGQWKLFLSTNVFVIKHICLS